MAGRQGGGPDLTAGIDPMDTMQSQTPARQYDLKTFLIHQRTQGMQPSFVTSYPATASSIITSGIPEDQIRDLPRHMQNAMQWVDSQYQFAGIQGALTGLATQAVMSKNRTQKAAIFNVINMLKGMTPADQSAFVSWVQGGAAPTNLGQVTATPLGTGISAPETTYAPGNPETPTGQVNIQATNVEGVDQQTQRVAALEAVFPSLRGKIDFVGGPVTLEDLRDSINNQVSEARVTWFNQKFTGYAPANTPGGSLYTSSDFTGSNVNGKILNWGKGLIKMGFSAMQAPVNAVAGPLGTIEGNWESGVGPGANFGIPGTNISSADLHHVVSSGIDNLAAPYSRIANNYIQDAVGMLGTATQPVFWTYLFKHPGSALTTWAHYKRDANASVTNDYAIEQTSHNMDTVNVLGGLLFAAVLHAASTVAGAAGDVQDQPVELLKAKELANQDVIDKMPLSDKIFHPFRTWADPKIRAAVIDTVGKTVQEWATKQEDLQNVHGPISWLRRSTPANAYFDRVEEVASDPSIPADMKFAAAKRIGLGLGNGVTDALLKDLLDSPRPEMYKVVVEHMTGDSPTVINQARTNVQAAQDYLNEVRSQLSDARAAAPTPTTPTYAAGTVFHGTKGAVSSVSDLSPLQYGAPEALAGPGVYVTDNEEVAAGYARTKGAGPSGTVLPGTIAPGTNLLNADVPMPDEVAQSIETYVGQQTYLEGAGEDFHGLTWMQAVKKLGRILQDSDVTRTDATEIFTDLQDRLNQEFGYDGVQYQGGVRVGKVPHQATVLWETEMGGLEGKLGPASRLSPDSQQLADANGRTVTVPARTLLPYLEFPDRAIIDEAGGMKGRTPEQVQALRDSFAGGYDVNRPYTEGGGPVGPITLEVDPETGQAIVREAHHRIGVLAEQDGDVPVQIQIADLSEERRGAARTPEITNEQVQAVEDRYGADSMQARLIRLRQTLGQPLDMGRVADIGRGALPNDITPEQYAQVQGAGRPVQGAPITPDLFDRLVNQNDVAELEAKVERANQDLVAAKADASKLTRKNPEQIFFPGADYYSLENFLHRAVVSQNPSGLMENLTARLLSPVRTVEEFSDAALGTHFNPADSSAAVTKLIDKLSGRPFAWNPLSDGYDSAKSEESVTQIRRVGQRLGMSTMDIDRVVADLNNATTSSDVFKAWENFAKRRMDYLPRDMSPVGKTIMGRAFDRDFYEGYNTIDVTDPVTGIVTTEPVNDLGDVINGARQHQPLLPQEMLMADKLYMPAQDVVDEATHFMSRWEQSSNLAKRITAQTYGFAKVGGMILGRTLGLPLWAAFKLPALLFKHAADSSLSNLASPDMLTGIRPPQAIIDAWDRISTPTMDQLGSVNEGILMQSREFNVPIPTANFVTGGGVTVEGAQALVDRMRYYSDPLSQELLRNNFDVPKTIDRMTGQNPDVTPNPALQRYYEATLSQEVPADQMPRLLERQSEAIRQASLRSPEYLDMMKNQHMMSGDFVSYEYPDQVAADLADIRARLKELNPVRDQAAIRVLQEQLAQKLDEGMAAPETTSQPVSIDSDQALVKDLQDRFSNNELQLPRDVRVTRLGRSSYVDAYGKLQMDHGSTLELAREVNAKLSKLTYRVFQPVGWADAQLGRRNYWMKTAYDYYHEFTANGMDTADAEAAATMRASIATKNRYYDLTARSTAETSSKNIFWFAPASGELMYKWFYRVPADQGGALIGNLLTYAKVENYINLAKSMGAIYQRPDGRLMVAVPGAARILNDLEPGPDKYAPGEQISVSLSSFDPLVTQPIPTMGPLPAKALTEVAKHVHALQGLANVLAPFGASSTMIPYTARNWANSSGVDVSDPMSNDAVQEQWRRQQITGMQLALAEAQKSDPQPTEAQYHLDPAAPGYLPPTDPMHDEWNTKYQAAMKVWIDNVFKQGQNYAMGIAQAHTLFGNLLPGSGYVSTPGMVDWEKFLQETANLDPQQWAYAKAHWLDQHPSDYPYSVTGTLYNGIKVPKGTDPMQIYVEGYAQHMTPDEYIHFAAAMQSKFLYDQRIFAGTQAAGSTSPDVLKNWYQHSTNLQNFNEEWQQYLRSNPDAAAIVAKQQAKLAEAYPQYAARTDESQLLNQTMTNLQTLSPIFTGTGTLTTSEYNTVMSTLKQKRAELLAKLAQTGQPVNAVTQGVNWYFDTVLDPYMQATKPIWDQIQINDASGVSSAAQYQELAALDQKYNAPSYRGQNYPSPSEFFYDAQAPAQKMVSKIRWSGEPPNYLTPFQQQLVGYKAFDGESAMWTAISNNDQRYAATLAAMPAGSTAYTALKASQNATDQAIAGQYGQEGLAAYQASQQAPYERLQALGVFKSDSVMQQAFQMAQTVSSSIVASGGSPGGSTSATEIAMKTWFYSWLNSQTDPTFQHDMDLLSLGLTNAPGGRHPMGADLYEAIFFNQFQPAYIGASVRAVGAEGNPLGASPNG